MNPLINLYRQLKMKPFKLNTSLATRLTFFILVISITSFAHIFNVQTKTNYNSTKHLDNYVNSSSRIKEQTVTQSLLLNNFIKSIETDPKINLSPFEIEEEDDLTYSKKSFKIYPQKTAFYFHRFLVGMNVSQSIIDFCSISTLSKTPLYISYQVYRI